MNIENKYKNPILLLLLVNSVVLCAICSFSPKPTLGILGATGFGFINTSRFFKADRNYYYSAFLGKSSESVSLDQGRSKGFIYAIDVLLLSVLLPIIIAISFR